jgi:hypothetical protein
MSIGRWKCRQEASMDTGLVTRPAGPAALTGYVPPEPTPVRGAVPTILAPSQSVMTSADAAAIRNETARPQPVEPSTTHDIVIDPASREVLYRIVDVRSGQILQQIPDHLFIRMEVYTKVMESGKSALEAAAKADLDLAV